MRSQPGRLAGVVTLATLLMAAAVPAAAQDESTLALVASFPSPAVSVQWQVSDRFALRFEGSYSFSGESRESTPDTGRVEHIYRDGTTSTVVWGTGSGRHESTVHGGSVGISGLITLHRAEQLRLYVAPRLSLGYTRQRLTGPMSRLASDSYVSIPLDAGVIVGVVSGGLVVTPASPDTVRYSSTSPAAGAAFGAATSVHRRLSLFGEAGFMYSRDNLPPLGTLVLRPQAIDDIDVRRTTIYTRAIAGLMIHF